MPPADPESDSYSPAEADESDADTSADADESQAGIPAAIRATCDAIVTRLAKRLDDTVTSDIRSLAQACREQGIWDTVLKSVPFPERALVELIAKAKPSQPAAQSYIDRLCSLWKLDKADFSARFFGASSVGFFDELVHLAFAEPRQSWKRCWRHLLDAREARLGKLVTSKTRLWQPGDIHRAAETMGIKVKFTRDSASVQARKRRRNGCGESPAPSRPSPPLEEDDLGDEPSPAPSRPSPPLEEDALDDEPWASVYDYDGAAQSSTGSRTPERRELSDDGGGLEDQDHVSDVERRRRQKPTPDAFSPDRLSAQDFSSRDLGPPRKKPRHAEPELSKSTFELQAAEPGVLSPRSQWSKAHDSFSTQTTEHGDDQLSQSIQAHSELRVHTMTTPDPIAALAMQAPEPGKDQFSTSTIPEATPDFPDLASTMLTRPVSSSTSQLFVRPKPQVPNKACTCVMEVDAGSGLKLHAPPKPGSQEEPQVPNKACSCGMEVDAGSGLQLPAPPKPGSQEEPQVPNKACSCGVEVDAGSGLQLHAPLKTGREEEPQVLGPACSSLMETDAVSCPTIQATLDPGSQEATRLTDPRGWLNDAIIDLALSTGVALGSRHNLVAISCLASSTEWNPVNHQRYIQRLQSLPRDNLEVFIPLNTGGCHWLLAYAQFATRDVYLYDSLSGKRDVAAETRRHLHSLLGRIFAEDAGRWRITVCASPQQPHKDTFSCGIYLVASAFYLTAGKPLPARLDPLLWRSAISCLLLSAPGSVDKHPALWPFTAEDDDAVTRVRNTQQAPLDVCQAWQDGIRSESLTATQIRSFVQDIVASGNALLASHERRIDQAMVGRQSLLNQLLVFDTLLHRFRAVEEGEGAGAQGVPGLLVSWKEMDEERKAVEERITQLTARPDLGVPGQMDHLVARMAEVQAKRARIRAAVERTILARRVSERVGGRIKAAIDAASASVERLAQAAADCAGPSGK